MKCPKCGYLGFEPIERCRNCGYDFSLIPALDSPELPIRGDSTRDLKPLEDLTLVDAALPLLPAGESRSVTPDLDRGVGPRSAQSTGELPLFGAPVADDDAPLITRPSPPRPPLAVRRATPEVPRLRTVQPRAQMLDLSAADAGPAPSPLQPGGRKAQDGPRAGEEQAAGLLARVAASAIDLAILAGVDLIVIYFTMQICGLALEDVAILPKGPLVAFLLVQNGGYLIVFTTGGQTLGKMVAGIRVVPAHSDSSVDFGHATLRTLVWLLLAVPAGLGFLTALLSRDRRGLHDRCAGTCVVRASN